MYEWAIIVSIIYPSRIEENNDVDIKELSISNIETDDSRVVEGDEDVVDSSKNETTEGEIIQEQKTKIEELKSLVNNLMTQLLRLNGVKEKLAETRRVLNNAEKSLVKEKNKSSKYLDLIRKAREILNLGWKLLILFLMKTAFQPTRTLNFTNI